jgi:hypothetical protein
MTRTASFLLGALALVLCASVLPSQAQQVQGQPVQGQPAQTQASQALVGTWSTTVNWNLPSGMLITTSFLANGRIQATIQNHKGMSFTLAGAYQFNAAQNALSYKWQDFSPKQTCIDGACTPAQPPAQMGVVISSTIRFLSATEFVATSNGASTLYVRTNAVGTPVP